jgi:hypothetical protein
MSWRLLVPSAVGAIFLVFTQTPARAQGGGAMIRGQIVATDSGRPLRRALITASPEVGGQSRTANTNTDGRYEIKDLPEGRYKVSVVRSGYLPLQYGQHRPLEQAKLLEVVGRGVIDHVDFALPRMGVIAGRITDERGDPIAGVLMLAMRSMYVDGRRQLVSASGFNIRTDDAGQYRLPELVPGTYFVMATTRETWTVHSNGRDDVMGFQPTFFPGSNDVAEARQVSVGFAQQARDVNFSLLPARTAKVSGTAVDSHGRPLAGRSVGLTQTFRGAAGGGGNFSFGNGAVASDGTFTIKNVPPGEYKLQARAPSSSPGTDDEAAALTIRVNGLDIDHIMLTTSIGSSITGRINTESGAAPSISTDRARIIATVPDVANPRGGPPGGKTRINNDWTFAVTDLFGPARLRLNLPEEWAVKALLREGRDVTDMPFATKAGEELSGVEIILTNRVTSVGGQVIDNKGAVVTDGTVIVFAADSQKWQENSRFVRAARPDEQGTWQISGLPPGEYLATAIDYVPEGMWNDPEYLDALRGGAQKVALSEGGSQTVLLRLVASK